MDCQEARKYMMDALDETLAADVRPEWEQHLAQCAECRTELDDLRRGLHAVRSRIEEIEAETVRYRIPGVLYLPRQKTLTLARQCLVAAALFAVTVAFLINAGYLGGRSGRSQAAPPYLSEGGQPPATIVPVFITSTTPGPGQTEYSVVYPNTVQFSRDEWERLRRNATEVIEYARERPAPDQKPRKYSTAPVVLVRDE